MNPKISIVIPHYNNYSIIEACLKSIISINYSNLEIIVVDNQSYDNSVDSIRKDFPFVDVIVASKNLGFAGGCNLGAKRSTGKYILFLNNDTEMEKDFLEPLVKILRQDSSSSVQPKIRNYKKSHKFDYAGACGGFMDFLVFPFARGRIFDTIEQDKGQYNQKKQIFWASGTCFLTKKEIFDSVGGFDETLFAHMEEIDYHWRCQLMGYKVWVEPKSIIYHHGATTLKASSPLKTYLNHRNSFILLLTNYSLLKTILFLPAKIILELASFFRELMSLRLLHAGSHLYAWLWILFHPSYIVKKKMSIYKTRKIKDALLIKQVIYKKSIAWMYFMRKKSKFSSLEKKF